MKALSILGSTGSIGCQALEVVDIFPEKFKVVSMAAGRNLAVLCSQIEKYRPSMVSVLCQKDAETMARRFSGYGIEFLWGQEGLSEVAACPEAEVVLTAVTGVAGLIPTIRAIKEGKDIALANKETLVAAGSIVTALAEKHQVKILPVDSEHSAIWQCLQGSQTKEIENLILTASGGPFRKDPQDLERVNITMTLNHPNWSMGRKITVDSATLMNKGLEVIEARWLFGIGYDNIKVVIHPQSIIHSMVEYIDGSVLAQLGNPDMKLPIQYALGYPIRLENNFPRLNFLTTKALTFHPPDLARFPALGLAYI
ncbi:MAG: 1-deoxy-D-xylulose-5-phosphate reductoisomerase, partial [Peptococcaceae bacterium]|nr:1-deoxy-D-xylulose-5-phosphate reductoisomerase [Peptococcaceae bacterium]